MEAKKSNKKIAIYILFVVLFLNLVFGAVSFMKTGTWNYPKAAFGFIQIASGKAEYVTVKNEPNQIILASPENPEETFAEYLIENGYSLNEAERMGAMRAISKDGNTEYVLFSVNSYFSKWEWTSAEK